MNTRARNQKMWGEFGWERRGEHWSDGWGNSDAQWHFSTRPRIARYLPSETICEIATGYGRWTKYLVAESARYWGFDLVEKCAEHCEATYGGPDRKFIANDGLHLTGVPDGTVDFVFSFDSLVHVDWETLKSYLSESLRVLKPGGVAVLHHSNAADVDGFETLQPPKVRAFRAPDVSARDLRNEVERLGGGIVGQEIINWISPALIDCISTFTTRPVQDPVVVQNGEFMADMRRIAKIAPIYAQNEPVPPT